MSNPIVHYRVVSFKSINAPSTTAFDNKCPTTSQEAVSPLSNFQCMYHGELN